MNETGPAEADRSEARGWRGNALALYRRHRRAFWLVHSVWALATGLVVVVLAHESYGYAVWVLAFLALTWASTFFFSRLASDESSSREILIGHEIASYATRVMYQETLFFLLPFYYYSTTLDSSNVLFLVLLAGLAVLACLDLVFDELLRRYRWFGLAFFAGVSFSALNFLLPLVVGLSLDVATPAAAAIGLGTALPLVFRRGELTAVRNLARMGVGLVGVALLLTAGRFLIPPVPLQLESVTFARDVDPQSLEAIDPLSGTVVRTDLSADRLAAVARISAPRRLEARVELSWFLDGELLEVSRELEVVPHEAGFRVWDTVRSAQGELSPGRYRLAVRTAGGQLIGRAALDVVASTR